MTQWRNPNKTCGNCCWDSKPFPPFHVMSIIPIFPSVIMNVFKTQLCQPGCSIGASKRMLYNIRRFILNIPYNNATFTTISYNRTFEDIGVKKYVTASKPEHKKLNVRHIWRALIRVVTSWERHYALYILISFCIFRFAYCWVSNHFFRTIKDCYVAPGLLDARYNGQISVSNLKYTYLFLCGFESY